MQINSSAFQTGVNGFKKAEQKLNEAAETIAKSNTTDNNVDITEAAVDLVTAEIDAKANAKSIEAASNTIGSLLDIKV